MRILIIGGYGTFGGRLVDLIRDEPRLTLLVAGRNLAAAEAFCRKRTNSAATLMPTLFDRTDAGTAISGLKPDLVVDAAGPFQLYGSDPYRMVRAALEAGADWIDLADSIDFVTGIGAVDTLAREKGRFVLAGASSFPVLSAAVVRRLAAGMPVDTISIGIAPSPFAGVGLNVIRAIASYAGKPLQVLEGGRRQTLYGLISSRTMTVNVPSRVPLPPIRFALVGVPDLDLLPREWPEAQGVWVGAGPTPAFLHRLLWCAAWLVRWRLVPTLVPFAPLMNWAVNTFRWGAHRGDMVVEITGGGQRRSWNLLGEGDAGPLIPVMAIEAILRRSLAGNVPVHGARPAHHDLELSDYEPLFARRGIVTGMRDDTPGTPYLRILGSAFTALPKPVQKLHSFEASVRYSGRGKVEGAANPLAGLIAAIFGFPRQAPDVPVTVELTRESGVETWTRHFGPQTLRSTQAEGTGRYIGLMVERFGPTRFGMAVLADGTRLGLKLQRWDILGVPMPKALMPRVTAGEHADDGRFHFHVDIGLPFIGRLVRYEGWLAPAA